MHAPTGATQPLKVLLTGGTGLIGRHVTAALLARGDEVTCVTRDAARAAAVLDPRVAVVEADPGQQGPWQERAAAADAVINLAGESLAAGWLWTRGRRRRLRRSRLRPTTRLAEALRGRDAPAIFLSASASGYYGDAGEEAVGEDDEPGHDFLAMLVCEWERAALAVASERCRVVVLRFGVVLAPDGGALAALAAAFGRGLGARLGHGRQYVPWVHVEDLVRAVLFALDDARVRGPVNVCAPDPPRQRDFAQALGAALGRPVRWAAPAPLVRLALGGKSGVLLAGQRMVPGALRALGFGFRHPDLPRALADLLRASALRGR